MTKRSKRSCKAKHDDAHRPRDVPCGFRRWIAGLLGLPDLEIIGFMDLRTVGLLGLQDIEILNPKPYLWMIEVVDHLYQERETKWKLGARS